MGAALPRLVRPARPAGQGLARSRLDGPGGRPPAAARGRCRRRGERGTADRLGLRSDLFRRRAHDGRASRPGLDGAADRDRACQRPSDERQLGHAPVGRHRPRQRGRGGGQVRDRPARRRADRRAAGAGGDVPGRAQDRRRRPAGADDRTRRARLRPPGLHAGRHHRDRPGQQADRERLPGARDRARRRRVPGARRPGVPGLPRHPWRRGGRRAREEPGAAATPIACATAWSR